MFSLLSFRARTPAIPRAPVTETDLMRAHVAAAEVERTIRSELAPFSRAHAHALGLAAVSPLVAIFVFGAPSEVVFLVLVVDVMALVLGDRIRLARVPLEAAQAVRFIREAAHVDATIRAIARPVGWAYHTLDRADDDLALVRRHLRFSATVLVWAIGIPIFLLSVGAGFVPSSGDALLLVLPLLLRVTDAFWEARSAHRRSGIQASLLPQSDAYIVCLVVNAMVWPCILILIGTFRHLSGELGPPPLSDLFMSFFVGMVLSVALALWLWSRSLRRRLPALRNFLAKDRGELRDHLERWGSVAPQPRQERGQSHVFTASNRNKSL
jgi:hypothetical protein